jgi:acetyl esterase/lipase
VRFTDRHAAETLGGSASQPIILKKITMQAALSSLPLAAQAEMERIGPIWGSDIQKHRDIVLAAYDPILAKAPKDGVTITRNHAYGSQAGSHARQVLDVYQPARGQNSPVVVFMHGGAFVRGDKQASPEVYDNVLIWFARHGYVGVNIEFRLAPEAAYPCGADDLAASIAWVKANIAGFGGDPQTIFVIGHSAGGTHVATFAYDPAAGHLARDVAGIVLISARLAADVLPENPNAAGVRAYFGTDESVYAARSPMHHGATSALPVFIVNAEYENPLLDLYGLEFAHRIAVARRRAPRYMRLPRHNHISIVAHFNSGEDTLGNEILDFFATRR